MAQGHFGRLVRKSWTVSGRPVVYGAFLRIQIQTKEMRMFIIRDDQNQESAPMDAAAIHTLMREGKLSLDSSVRRVQDSAWSRLRDLPELAPSIPPTPPNLTTSTPAAPPPIAPGMIKTSRAAIGSLVCGILNFFSCGLTGIVGLILGIRALSLINKNKSTLGGKGLATAGIVLSGMTIILLPISAGLMLPALAKAKARAQRISCVNNMKQVALAVRIYSNDHKEVFPGNLNVLESELVNPRVLICPGDSGHIAFPTGTSWGGMGPQNISYQYLLPGAEEGKTSPSEIMLICPIHGNEAHADGSVHQTSPTPRNRR